MPSPSKSLNAPEQNELQPSPQAHQPADCSKRLTWYTSAKMTTAIATHFRGIGFFSIRSFLSGSFTTSSGLVDGHQRTSDLGGSRCHCNAGILQRGNLGFRTSTAPGNDGSRMPHSTPRRSRGACNERSNGFVHVLFDVGSRSLLCGSTNLSDHDNRIRLRIFIKKFDHIEVTST